MKNRPLKSALKDFFFFWRPSLSRRLTLSFTVFGLAIGYAVLYLSGYFFDQCFYSSGDRLRSAIS